MKNLFTAILLLLNCFLFSQGDHTVSWDLEDIICKEQESTEKRISYRNQQNEFAYQTDMHYQVMNWEINPSAKFISGDVTYYFKSRIADLTSLVLDMSNSLQVISVTRNGSQLQYTHTPDQLLTIELGKTLGENQFDTVTVDYEGVPPSNGFGSFEQGTHAGAPIIWTLSEPYGARDWWPNKQDLIDKIDSCDIFITTPTGQLAASNGKLMSITNSGGQLVHHWRHRYPIVAYLVALAVTNYSAYSDYVHLDNGDSIEILNYVYPETLQQSKTATQSSVDIMGFYNELFGIYPFAAEKYGHAQFGWGGGEEHQTMSFMGGFSYGLQAHEMAHQWFGNKVTCGSWVDIWLNEGFATYLTGLTYERFSPSQYWPQWKISTLNSVVSQAGGSVYVDDTTSVGRIFNGRLSYNKGAYLLHMARWVMGDSSFYQACRNYLDIPGTAYDFGRTEELKGYLESASGRDFDEFLQDWFYGQGYPTYDIRWSHQQDSLIVWVGQNQSHSSVSFFEMPIPILVVLDGIDNIFRVEHTYDEQRFSFFIGGATVDSIGFDPDLWLLSKNNTIQEIVTGTNPFSDDPFIVFPNPATDFITILPSTTVKKVSIVTMTGMSDELSIVDGQIDIHQLIPGMYTLLLKNGENQILSTKRIVINR